MAHHFEWIVSQVGARQHYSVPRGFLHQGSLRTLYTDVWCRWGSGLLRKGPGAARALAGRFHPDLPGKRVVSFPFRSAYVRWRAPRIQTTEARYEEYLRFGVAFSRWVSRDLEKQTLEPSKAAFFGFNTGCLETLKTLRARGVVTVVDQIDPARSEEELVLQEVQKWPGWQETPGRIPAAYFERLSAEWDAADLVVVNSEWSSKALITQGVPAEKLLIVPLAYEVAETTLPPGADRVRTGTLTVLWLGTVNLRKGIPYLMGAAGLLQRANVRFIVAGPLEISRAAVATAPANMDFVGRVTRGQADEYYRRADVFVLPTISDGFAITQIEAMAQGLPVITTPHCGEVVTDGVDGLLVPAGDERALAEAIAKLDADRELLRSMSRQAITKARTFKLPRQAVWIESALQAMRQPAVAGWVNPQK
jgi:glycosyltransferase involved in cell wall biosynthesis